MEEKKRRTTTSAQVKNRYNAKAYDRLSLVLRRDGSAGCTKEDIQAAAVAADFICLLTKTYRFVPGGFFGEGESCRLYRLSDVAGSQDIRRRQCTFLF